jgi:hypothetical protein
MFATAGEDSEVRMRSLDCVILLLVLPFALILTGAVMLRRSKAILSL